MRADGHRDEECSHPHGYYLPADDIKWHKVTTDHHKVYLLRVKPGNVTRTHILIGEVRRHTPGLSYANGRRHPTRFWRAFPEGGPPEFPEAFENHVAALQYLKNRWESGPVTPEPPRQRKPSRVSATRPAVARPPSWVDSFGDLWEEFDAGD